MNRIILNMTYYNTALHFVKFFRFSTDSFINNHLSNNFSIHIYFLRKVLNHSGHYGLIGHWKIRWICEKPNAGMYRSSLFHVN